MKKRKTRKSKKTPKHVIEIPPKPKYLIHATEYSEKLETILQEGIRPSSNTGIGRFEYNMVNELTRPADKSKSNIIQFNQVFTELLYDPYIKYNNVHQLPEYIIILDMQLIEDLCKDKGCHLGLGYLAGKKMEGKYLEYDVNESLDYNLKSWTKHIISKNLVDALIQNELVFSQPIDPKYIKAVLLLPPMHKNYYIDDNHKVWWIAPDNKKRNITKMYSDMMYDFTVLEKKYPKIKFAITWNQLDEIL